jgi:hypothetical protein
MNSTEAIFEIHRIVGRLEGRFDGVEKLSERVSKIEACQAWLKGIWVAFAAALGYICKRHI